MRLTQAGQVVDRFDGPVCPPEQNQQTEDARDREAISDQIADTTKFPPNGIIGFHAEFARKKYTLAQ